VFANALGQRELPRLDYMNGGINYMIPTPGAKVENGLLKANVAFPGLSIRYTTDGSEPTNKSPLFNKEIQSGGTIKLATFTKKGRASRVVALK
jgi:hexosaminidase